MHPKIVKVIDHLVLQGLDRQIPSNFEPSYAEAEPLAYYIEESVVHFGLEGRSWADILSKPGPQVVRITLRTPLGLVASRLKILPSDRPNAPVILCHHGLGQRPFDFVARHLVEPAIGREAHIISLQAPYHHNWRDPLQIGFYSLAHLNQMLAGSVVVMAALQRQLEPSNLMVVGLSLGGIVSLLYQGLYGQAQTVVPICASPDLAQVMLDQAVRFRRELIVTEEIVRERLDFSEICLSPAQNDVYPILADGDLFFRYDHHCPLYGDRPVLTLENQGHVTGPRDKQIIQKYIQKLFSESCFSHIRSSPTDQRTMRI